MLEATRPPTRIARTRHGHTNAIRAEKLQSHTHVQQVAGCLHVDTWGRDGP